MFEKLHDLYKDAYRKYPMTEFRNELFIDEQVAALFAYVSTIKDLTNDMVEYLNDFAEKFDTKLYKTVDDILQEWADTGFFDTLVNKGLVARFTKEMNERITNQDVKILEKIDKNGNEQVTLKNLSKEVVDLFTDSDAKIPINTSDISDGAITREKFSESLLKDMSVFKEQDEYQQKQINVFNKEIKANFSVGGMTSEGILTENVSSDPVIHSSLMEISLNNNLTITPLYENITFAIAYYNENGFIRRTDYRPTEFVNVLQVNESGSRFYIRLLITYNDNRLFYNENITENNNLVKITQRKYKWLEVENSGIDLAENSLDGTINTLPKNSVNTMEFISSPAWRNLLIDVKENDIFYIYGVGGDNARLFSFVDENNKTIKRASYSLTERNVKLVTPKNAKKLIVNLNINYPYSVYKEENKKNKNVVANKTIYDGYNYSNEAQTGAYNIPNVGEVLDFSTANNGQSLWRNIVIDVQPGEKFYIQGRAGNSPRLWAMLDQNNKVISKASVSSDLIKTTITVSAMTKTLVLNYQLIGEYYAFKYDENSNVLLKLLIETNKQNEQKFLIDPTSEKILSSVINGQNMSEELNQNVMYFQKPGDKMTHVSTFKIIDDIVYMTYYANTISSGEVPTEHVIRFVYGKINTSERTYVDIQKIGDSFDGKTVQALYDTILMTKDNNEIFIMWTAILNGVYYRLYQTYNIATKGYSPIYKNKFKIGESVDDFSITGMTSLFNEKNISHKTFTGDIGIMQKLSSRNENGSIYYYTGCYCGPFNCIIKSKDLVVWEFVSQPDFENNSQWENAVYVLNDKVYYFVRQYSDLSPFGFLTYYDLSNGKWETPIYVNDAQSRSDFIYWNNNLYLIHAPNNRNYISVMLIDKQFLNKSYAVQTAMVNDMFYPYVDTYNGELYMSLTRSRIEIRLAKITIEKYPKENIAEKLLSLMGE